MEQTTKSGHFYEAPAWAEYTFQVTAIAGIFWITAFLMRVAWPGSWNGHQAVSFREALPCISSWLFSVVMLWRQFRLKRWACTLAAVLAWITLPVIWLFSPLRELTSYANLLLLTAVDFLVAALLTAACAAGWKEMGEGF